MARKPFAQYVTGTVARVEHLGYTYYGNPMMKLAIVDADGETHIHRLSNNSGLAYGIENPEYRDHPHVFDLTPAGRVSGYTRTIPEMAAKSEHSIEKIKRHGLPDPLEALLALAREQLR